MKWCPRSARAAEISPTGGTRALWARNGRELFYLDLMGHLMAVPVQTSPGFSAGNPAKVFLMIKGRSAETSQSGQAASVPMVVVLNWFEELKQRVTAK